MNTRKYFPSLFGSVLIVFFTSGFIMAGMYFLGLRTGYGDWIIYVYSGVCFFVPVIILSSTIPKYNFLWVDDAGIKVNGTFYSWKHIVLYKINNEKIEHKVLHFFTVSQTSNEIIELLVFDEAHKKVKRKILVHNKVYKDYNSIKKTIFEKLVSERN